MLTLANLKRQWCLFRKWLSSFFNLCLPYNTIVFFSGATKSVYAPEPFDVGHILQVDIISEHQHIVLSTTGPIDPGMILLSHPHLI